MSTTSSAVLSHDTSPVGANSLPCGVINVTVTKFRSIGAITPLEATLSGWSGFQMSGGQPLPSPAPTMTLNGDNVQVSSKYPVRLIFNLPDPRYLLLGIAWQSTTSAHQAGGVTFPEVLIRRGVHIPGPFKAPVPGGSCMLLTDNANLPGSFEYIILLQEAATGELGILDPDMTNNPPA